MRQESPRPSDGVTPPPAPEPGPGPHPGFGAELVPVTRRRHGAEDEPDDPVALSPAALWAGLRASVAWGDLVAAVILALVLAATGLGTGALWSWIGPHVPVLMTANGPILAEYYGESSAGQQATFGGLALVVGLLAGPIAYVIRRRRGPIVLIGLAAGCLAAAWISWKFGVWVGQSEYESLLQIAAPGREFEMPVELDARGLLFLEPLVAVLGYVLVAAWSRYPDLKADPTLNREHGRHWGSRPPDQ
ncbi:DUF2567 domain-containing protein [Cryptosporangium japonicum]|uniref:DUF2567 domain-containing protein n=1 Tax=Cryptosporangium japonicum TaxID=80872 RepID=A0ABN0TEW2_9ACTN